MIHTKKLLTFGVFLCAVVAVPALGQPVEVVPAEQSVAATPDSLAATAVDSLGSSGIAAETDSLRTAEPDSIVDFAEPVDPRNYAPETHRNPQQHAAVPSVLRWRRAETLEDVVETVPGAVLRVAGDNGMPAFLSLSPISGNAPELWMDGIPTLSPADRDPGVWDRSALPVQLVSGRARDAEGSWGGPQLWITSDEALEGRTYLRSYFGSVSSNETYARSLSLTTPATGRIVRFDFEEWKTEKGIAYSVANDVLGDALRRGRSKMRRFRVSTDFETEVGRLKMFFGRGRRYYRGSALRTTSRERWTGELGLGLDHSDSSRTWTARAYHLDTHDEDEAYLQSDTGSRLGLRIDRIPAGQGIQFGLHAEKKAARFETLVGSELESSSARTKEVRAAVAWRNAAEARWKPWGTLEGLWSEHTDQRYSWAGAAGLKRVWGRWEIGTLGERVLRTPTLVETSGRFSFDAVRPTATGFVYDPSARQWSWVPNASLAYERQERAAVSMTTKMAGLVLGVELGRWRLRDGIGTLANSAQELLVVADRELNVDQVSARMFWVHRSDQWRYRAWGHGHRVLGDLEADAGRGSGWPTYAMRGRFGIDRVFFSRHNRLGVDLEVDVLGPHRDDLTGAFGGQVEASTILDLRIWLSMREAEIAIAYDNLLDNDRSEVLGTYRRGRQMRLELSWPFTN